MSNTKKRKKSIFSRLVISYAVFLILSLILYLVVALIFLVKMGGGDVSNLSPQSIVREDGTITDLSVLERNGGWVEELDSEGNVITTYGEAKFSKDSYTITELATLLDLGYMDYDQYGVVVKNQQEQISKDYTAYIRSVSDPERIFIVVFPSEMVSYKITFNIDNEGNNGAITFLFVIAALFLTEVLIISFYLKRHIDKPLRHLKEGMDEVSEGKRDIVLDYNTDKEFDEIRDRFNRMAEKLKESEEENLLK